MAEKTAGRSDCAAHVLAAARLNLHSPPESPLNWEKVHPNLNDYHSDPMEIRSTFRWLDVVLATVPDSHFGSGTGSKPNRCHTGRPGRQLTRTAHSGKVLW